MASGSPSSSSMTATHHCGIARRKFTVPSRPSTSQRREDEPTLAPSSPTIASPGRSARNSATMASSLAWSAADTRSAAEDLRRTSSSPPAMP